MISQPTTMIALVASAMKGKSSQRLAWAAAIVFGAMTSDALAVQYDFLSVSGNNVGGNGASSQFDSDITDDFIKVTHSFPDPAGAAPADNLNNAIFPSQFTTLFPGTGLVDGHLAQTHYGYASVVSFNLQNYDDKPLKDLVFGIWNCTDETPANPPGVAQYRLQLIDSGGNFADPVTFNLIGNQQNQTQLPQARRQLVMNLGDGDITAGALINPGGKHMNAAFWNNIPAGTKEIRVYAFLDPLNFQGDGVGYYFAEIVPEPTSSVMAALGLLSLGMFRRRHSC